MSKMTTLNGLEVTDAYARENMVVKPTSAKVGQMLIVKSVDENGIPTEWEVSDVASGGSNKKWNLIASVMTTEEVSFITITNRLNGTNLNINGEKEIVCFFIAAPSATNTEKKPSQFSVNGSMVGYCKDSIYNSQYYTKRWMEIDTFSEEAVLSFSPSFAYSTASDNDWIGMSNNTISKYCKSIPHPITSIGYNATNGGVFGIGSHILIYERG